MKYKHAKNINFRLCFNFLVIMASNDSNVPVSEHQTNLNQNSKEISMDRDVPDEQTSTSNIEYMAYERLIISVRYIMKKTEHRPQIAIICGTGLAGLGDLLDNPDIIDYEDIPNFPVTATPGHKSRMLLGNLQGVPIMLMQGRFHHYEGHKMQLCGMPVRVMKLCGIENLIVTNAAGGLNPNFKVGDVMVIKDHINLPGLAGRHPLNGPNDERFGKRFFALNNCYDRKFRDVAKQMANELGVGGQVHEGVYSMLAGPNFETVAELRMLITCGVDAVGMSTIPEVLVARHCGMRVFAFSLITNKCTLDENEAEGVNHEEVVQAAKEKEITLKKFVSKVVQGINDLASTTTHL